MPKLSDSMEEANVLAWLKQPGDLVAKGEPLVEVETDKATIVYEAEAAGLLEEILVGAGNTAALGAVIAIMRSDAEDEETPRSPLAAQSASGTARGAPARRTGTAGRARATPVARRLAGELGVALERVTGTGPGGRIVAADVTTTPHGSGATPAANGRGATTERPHTPTQRTIARRMSASHSEIPDFTLETEIAMDAALRLREDIRAGGVEPPPSFNDLVIRAAALALRDIPELNTSYDEGRTLIHDRVNVGVAVAAEGALLVPVIQDADRKSLLEIAAESRRLVAAARGRRLSTAELADATFTISNLGMFGVRRFHAVINAPQAAILAVGEVAERPAVVSGRLEPRRLMDVTLSCDHRIVYGAEAARFLQRIGELLEHPTLLVLERRSP